MDLNLEAAFDEPVDLSHQFDFPAGSLARPELVSLSPVTFTGRLERQGPGFVLNGRVVFEGVTACARCLAHVSFRRASDALWVFAPAHEKPRDGKPAPKAERAGKRAKGEGDPDDGLELAPEDLDVVYYDDLVVPFDPLVEEQVQLELPLEGPLPGRLPRDSVRCAAPTGTSRRASASLPRTSAGNRFERFSNPELKSRLIVLAAARWTVTGDRHAESKAPPQQDAPRPAPRPRLPEAQADLDLPELRHRKAAAPGVPVLRSLQGPGSHERSREGLT